MNPTWKKTTYTQRQHENNWMNIVYQSHDQFCRCDDPQLHLLQIINRDSNAPKPAEEVRNIRCLLTGEKTTTTTTEEENGGFDEGDLENLFAQDTEDIPG